VARACLALCGKARIDELEGGMCYVQFQRFSSVDRLGKEVHSPRFSFRLFQKPSLES